MRIIIIALIKIEIFLNLPTSSSKKMGKQPTGILPVGFLFIYGPIHQKTGPKLYRI